MYISFRRRIQKLLVRGMKKEMAEILQYGARAEPQNHGMTGKSLDKFSTAEILTIKTV